MITIYSSRKVPFPITVLGIVFLFISSLSAQNPIKIKVVDSHDALVPNVMVKGPRNQQFNVSTGIATVDLGGSKDKLPEMIDHLKFIKDGWQTVSVEYFEKENEVQVILEASASPQKKMSTGDSESSSVPEQDGKNKSVMVKVVRENGTALSNLKLEGHNKEFLTSKNGSAVIPTDQFPYLNIKGYRILRTKQPAGELVIVVAVDTSRSNLEETIESVVNQVRIEQHHLEEANTVVLLEINNILKRLADEKSLSPQEKRKLRKHLKRLTDQVSDGDRQYEENKNKRDELLEKLNFLLLEKDSINKLNQIKIEKLQKEKELERQESTQRILIVSIIAAALSGVVLLLIFLMKKVNKQKSVLQVRNVEISEQKERIQSVYKELNDNIISAKLIQNAILPGRDLIRKAIPDLAIFYQPKNIVSGDFYWYYQKGNKTMIAAVDCTGHGVAGAFMSFLGYEILNQIVRENVEISAGGILSELNVKLIDTLSIYGSSGVSSGMDISLCVIDFGELSMEFAGANNSLYVLRKNKTEMEQIAADKQGIGGRQKASQFQFKTHTLPFQHGDSFLLYTDGYADQFGSGKLNQKFMYSQLRDQFVEIAALKADERARLMEKRFVDWKGEYEQLDDVLLVSFTL
jgi:serine phosphatase RsbU (regulator of sigma subunit)